MLNYVSCGWLLCSGPASTPPLEQWAQRFQEAERILADVVELVAERESVPASLPLELRRRTAEIRRKVAILETRMGLMQEDLSQLSNQQHMYILLRIDTVTELQFLFSIKKCTNSIACAYCRSLKGMRKLAEKFSALELRVKEVAAPFTKNASNR